MKRLLPILALAACYDPPDDLDVIPYDAPILSSEDRCRPEEESRVGCIVDGDTFDVRRTRCDDPDDGERFRLLGIDAPETATQDAAAECGADIATTELARLIDNRFITLTFDRECTGTFGRTLAYAWLDEDDARQVMNEDDVDDLIDLHALDEEDEDLRIPVNTYLLLRGFAPRFANAELEGTLRWGQELDAAQRLAQARRDGIWGTCPGVE